MNVVYSDAPPDMPDAVRDALDDARRAATGQVEVTVDGSPHVIRLLDLVERSGGPAFVLVVERMRSRNPLADAYERFRLSPREIDVLSLIIEGVSNRDIATQLCITEATVQDHVRSMSDKVGARRRGDLLARIFDAADR